LTLVRVAAVSLAGQSEGHLRGANIDSPRAGDTSNGYALDIRGWAVAASVPAVSVELMHKADCVWRVPVDDRRTDVAEAYPDVPGSDTSGFFVAVSALSLEEDFELGVRVRLDDKTRVPLGVIAGHREQLRSSYEPALAPLMVTTLGRTGSTAMIRLLEAHPQVVAYRPFRNEPRAASYWMGVLKSLSEPASYRRQLSPTGPIDKTWWLGERPPVPRRLGDPAIDEWLGRPAVEEIAAFCQGRIDGVYGQIAGAASRDSAVYFAEKLRPDWVPRLVWEIYPRVREIVLVRDFRDMVSSMLAFNAKRGFQGFRRNQVSSDAEFVTENVKGSAAALAQAWRERSDRAHLVRYEDLIANPRDTLEGILEYLELDSGAGTLAAMTAGLTERRPEDEAHRTASGPEASLGRWRSDLSPEMQAHCDQELGESLEAFGYPTSAQAWS
jgi:Sulfotransferase family